MTYPIPQEAFDDRLAITGTSGAGKTYAALGALARLLKRGSRVIAADPLGVMWGLRMLPDGVTPSPYKPVIFGGPHGDLPLTVGAASLIGETAATMSESCILDLSELGSSAAERRFMLAFLTALYRHANRDPVHLILDEADLWAPQKLMDKEGDAARLLGMTQNIVRRGRVKGFIPWLITQRPAVLSKDVLSQADGVVAMKLTASQDRDAIGAWIEGQADRAKGKEILALLPTMNLGEGVIWIPGRGVLKTSSFPENQTFDSSRTPKRGEVKRKVDLKALDLGKLKDRLGKVEAEAKANDPVALKARIASLEAEARKKPADGAPDMGAIQAARNAGEAGGIKSAYPRGFADGWKLALDHAHTGLTTILAKTQAEFDRMKFVQPKPVMPSDMAAAVAVTVSAPPPRPAPTGHPRRQPDSDLGDLTTPQKRVLQSLGFWLSMGEPVPTRAQVGGVAGYSPSSGNFGNVIGTMNKIGLVTLPSSGRVALADGAPSLTLSRDEARTMILGILNGPEQKLVMAMVGGTGPMTRDELGAATGYSASSGNFGNIIGGLCKLTVFVKPSTGMIDLAPWAREVLS